MLRFVCPPKPDQPRLQSGLFYCPDYAKVTHLLWKVSQVCYYQKIALTLNALAPTIGPWSATDGIPSAKASSRRQYPHFDKARTTQMAHLTTEALKISLLPGQRDCLKARPDGTILDGHHRIRILRKRKVNVDELAREIIQRGSL